MAKKIVGFIKLQVPAGKANPSPPIGPALGQRGLNIMEFCKAFNAKTQGMEPGLPIPVVITAFADKSFTFIMKTPPATVLIKKAAGVQKGSPKPHLDKVGKLTRAQVEEIAKTKEPDLTASDLDAAPQALFPGILKAARLGYDGKGQARVRTRDEARAAWREFGGVPCVLEALLALDYEISVVLARGFDGACEVFPIARNVHRDGILAVTTVGGELDPALQAQATEAAQAIARGLGYHGVLCVEFFVLTDGRLLVNEIAPRPHNSGHYSIDACLTSQFEQQARAMAGLPLGAPRLLAPAVMLNVLGDVWFGDGSDAPREPDWAGVLAVPGAKLHLYGKRDARRGRKMGHITCVAPTVEQAAQDAERAAAALGMPGPGAS